MSDFQKIFGVCRRQNKFARDKSWPLYSLRINPEIRVAYPQTQPTLGYTETDYYSLHIRTDFAIRNIITTGVVS